VVGGQVVGNPYSAPAPVSLGGGQYDPYRITQNTYSAADMNNSPLIRKLRGQLPSYGSQGYAGSVDVPSQGIYGLPTNINYGDYLRMQDGEQKMLSGLYSNPETGVDWESILGMAKQMAPRTMTQRVASAR
jgi:hypothetical protein